MKTTVKVTVPAALRGSIKQTAEVMSAQYDEEARRRCRRDARKPWSTTP